MSHLEKICESWKVMFGDCRYPDLANFEFKSPQSNALVIDPEKV